MLEVPEGAFSQDIVQSTFWNTKWFKEQLDERYGNLIVERLIMRITPNGEFATCSVLIGDSINYFIESQILDYSSKNPKIKLPDIVFKKASSSPFEDKVIEGLRDFEFLAGHVNEKGIWQIQDKNINLKWSDEIKLYGEIDVLAYNPELNLAILVECKVLNDVRDYKSYKNIVSKLVDDSEGFQVKLLKKSEWVNCALSKYYEQKVESFCVILTDIPFPVVNFENENIVLPYYANFIDSVENILQEYVEGYC